MPAQVADNLIHPIWNRCAEPAAAFEHTIGASVWTDLAGRSLGAIMRGKLGMSLVLAAALLAAVPARLGAQPTGTPPLPPEVIATVETWSRGAMMFVFFHEFGHMVIDLLKLPSTGPEEDAVDEFSTLILTELILQAPEEQKDFFAEVVRGGALFWKYSADRMEARGRSVPFYDEHSPDARRFANILCLATGADPLRFIPMAVKAGIPENRLHRCAGDYKRRVCGVGRADGEVRQAGQGRRPPDAHDRATAQRRLQAVRGRVPPQQHLPEDPRPDEQLRSAAS